MVSDTAADISPGDALRLRAFDELTGDHVRLTEALDELQERVDSGHIEGAAETLAGFRRELQDHLLAEEVGVLDVFAARSREAAGVVRVLELEHLEMKELLQGIGAALASRDIERVHSHVRSLRGLFRYHEMKERAVYAMERSRISDRPRGRRA